MKNMLCNMVEDILSNWSEAQVVVHTMKTKITDIEAQLTAMDNSFAWKGTTSISSLNGMKVGGRTQGGGASGSESGGRALTSLDGSGNGIDCSTEAPHVKPFLIPSMVEILFKRLKEMSIQQSEQQ